MSEEPIISNYVLAQVSDTHWFYVGLTQAPRSSDLDAFIATASINARPSLLSTDHPGPLLFGDNDKKGKIFYASHSKADFLCRLRLLENTTYNWEFFESKDGKLAVTKEGDLPKIVSSVSNSTRAGVRWEVDNRQSRGQFNFSNFLGSGWLDTGLGGRLRFEVISAKIGYETQYLALLRDLTDKSIALLFDASAPTSAKFTVDAEKVQQNDLEAFLLLSSSLPLSELQRSMTFIRAQPHSQLESDVRWLPVGLANGLYAVEDPIGRIRWSRDSATGRRNPHEVLDRKRTDSLDTPPNRLVKRALERFLSLASRVRNSSDQYGQRIASEAGAMEVELRNQLASGLMKSIRPLTRIPFENQVLQRREGYSQIFGAWIASGSALSVRDIKSGGLLSPSAENRQVPDLYEYWLFFFLADAIEGLPGASNIHKEYVNELNLEGKVSIALAYKDTPRLIVRCKVGAAEMYLALYYNRTFKKGSGYTSYSLSLRPDYTVECLPVRPGEDFLNSRKLAALSGEITYVHFDAKFRIRNLDLSKAGDNDDEQEAAGRDEIAKPEDIYKMHTYNEAIRGTAASVILFPGDRSDGSGLHNSYSKYKELIPGVGALSIPPGDSEARDKALGVIGDFLMAAFSLSPSSDSAYSKFRVWESGQINDPDQPDEGI